MASDKIPSIKVPQADRLDRVEQLIALVDAGIEENDDLAVRMGFDRRQVLYYKQAACILDFAVSDSEQAFELTDKGRAFLKAVRPDQKQLLLSEAVRECEVVKELLGLYTESELNRNTITRFLTQEAEISGTTPERRASTLIAWLKYAIQLDPESYPSLAQNAAIEAPKKHRRFSRGREGPLHLGLKEGVAENPSLLEEGLTLIQLEYPFPTNDRADILFIDANERFLGVEVEVDVGAVDVVGLMQAVKYKAMLALQFDVGYEDVRGMLVARSIHPRMQKRAERYNIDTREITSII